MAIIQKRFLMLNSSLEVNLLEPSAVIFARAFIEGVD